MKKKVLMMGAGLTLGSALLISSAFADIGGAQGYEAYKSAIKQTAGTVNATQHVAFSLKDNGKELLNVSAVLKENKTTNNMSGKVDVTSGAATQSFEFYDQAGKKIVKPAGSDTYNVFTESGSDHEDWGNEASGHDKWSKEGENVIDALVGNLKNYVNLGSAANGGQAVDMQLTGSQIPAAFNAIGSLVVKEALSGDHTQHVSIKEEQLGKDTFGIDAKQIAAVFPKLTADVNIDRVGLHATIGKDNYIGNQQADITISGKDAAGAAHQVVLSVDVDLTDLNATTPDTVDLTGKKIQTIDEKSLHGVNR